MPTKSHVSLRSFWHVNVIKNLKVRLDIFLGRRLDRIRSRWNWYETASSSRYRQRPSEDEIARLRHAGDTRIARELSGDLSRCRDVYREMVQNISNRADANRISVCTGE